MANQKYIKVTLRGETEPRIVLATLKNFYVAQGAKVERPTDEEVYAAVPQERQIGAAACPYNPEQEEDARVAKLEEELKKVQDNAAATVAELEAVNKELREKLSAADTTISESEKVIETLRKELAALAKPQRKAKADPEPASEA